MPYNQNTDVSLEQALNSLKSAADVEFESAAPIPASLNHSVAFFEHEQKIIFQNQRVCIGREDEIANWGDYLTHEIANVPVVVIRQQDDTLAAFVNACAHRSACLLSDKRGSAKRFSCRYHGWTYDTSGALIGAPYMEMKPEFDKTEHKLKPLHCEQWQGFVYVSVADQPTTVPNEVLKPFTDGVVGRYDMGCYQTMIRETMEWTANWKNLMENFIESYHVPIAHTQTFANHDKPLTDYICGEDSEHYCYHRAPQPHETGLGSAYPDNDRLEGEWRRMMIDFCIFPNHLVTLMPDYLWYISVQPSSVDRFRATWGVAFPPEVIDSIEEDKRETWISDFKKYMDVANDEDKTLVEALHIGTRSSQLPRGTYHPIERNLWQFNNYLARMCCN